MLKSFVKQSATYGIINVGQKCIDYLSMIVIISCFVPSEYGIISLNTSILLLLTGLFSLSLEGAVSRYYYKYNNSDNLRYFLGSVSVYIFIFSFILGVLFLFLSKGVFTRFFEEIPFSPYIQLAITIAALDPINRMYVAYLVVKRENKTYAWFYNSYILTKIVLLTASALYFKSIESYFIAYLLSVVIFVPFSFYRLSKVCVFNFKLSHIKAALSFSVYIIPLAIITLINTLVSRAILLNELDLDAVGIYSYATNFGQIVILLGTVINMSYVSFLMQKYEEDRDSFDHYTEKMSKIYFFLVSLLAVGLSLFYPIVDSFVPIEYQGTQMLISILAFSGVGNMYYIYATNFMSLKNELLRYKIVGLMINVVFNIAITYLLVNYVDEYSAAWGNFIGLMLGAVFLEYIASSKGEFRTVGKYKWFAPLLLVIVLAYINFSNIGNLYLLVVINITIFILFVFLIDYVIFHKQSILKTTYSYVKVFLNK